MKVSERRPARRAIVVPVVPVFMPIFVPVLGAALLVLGEAPAHGRTSRPPPAACVAAQHQAEELQQQDRLLEAWGRLAACGHPSCGPAVSRECRSERLQLDKIIPSLLPLVTDEAGTTLADVQLSVDGKPRRASLAGRPVPLDPGPHELTFRTDRGVLLSQKVVMVRGQRRRLLSVILGPQPAGPSAKAREPAALASKASEPATGRGEPPAATADVFDGPPPATALPGAPRPSAPAAEALDSEDPPRAPPPRRRSIGPYLLGTVGLVGLGGYALLTHWGRADNDGLVECKPLCPPETLDHIRRLYLAADVSAAVGIAALVGSTTWLVLRSGSAPVEERRSRTVLDIRPTRAGAIATVAGAF